MKKLSGLALVVALGAFHSLPAAAQDASTVLARVGATEITLGHAIALRSALPAQFQALPDETLFPAIVEQLIDQELLAQYKGDDLSLRDRLMLENELRNFTANAALTDFVNSAVTEDSVSEAYAVFAETFGQGEPVTEWNAAHILVRTEEEIATVVAELESGRDFADVARAYSIDGSAAQGGTLGWFGPGMMIEPFEQAVAALAPGETSAPVQTRFGWHVVRLIDSRIAQVPPLAEVRAELEQQIQREASRALVEELRAAAAVENLATGFDASLLSRADLLDD